MRDRKKRTAGGQPAAQRDSRRARFAAPDGDGLRTSSAILARRARLVKNLPKEVVR